MKDDWIMVRIRKRTRERMEACRASMLVASETMAKPLQLDDRDRLSLSRVIDMLLDARESHAKRRKVSAKKRRKGRGQEQGEQGQ